MSKACCPSAASPTLSARVSVLCLMSGSIYRINKANETKDWIFSFKTKTVQYRLLKLQILQNINYQVKSHPQNTCTLDHPPTSLILCVLKAGVRMWRRCLQLSPREVISGFSFLPSTSTAIRPVSPCEYTWVQCNLSIKDTSLMRTLSAVPTT